MSYQLTPFNLIQRLADGVHIPCDPQNADYRTYLAWVAMGNIAQPAAEMESAPDYWGFWAALLATDTPNDRTVVLPSLSLRVGVRALPESFR